MSKRKKGAAPSYLMPAWRVPFVCGACKKEIAFSPELDRWIDVEPSGGPKGQTPHVHEHLQTCSGVRHERDWKPPVEKVSKEELEASKPPMMAAPSAEEDREPEWI